MPKTKYEEIGRAEVKVDCYAGKTCDQHEAAWHGPARRETKTARLRGRDGLPPLTRGSPQSTPLAGGWSDEES